MQIDPTPRPERAEVREWARREILEALSASGLAPAQGVEGWLDRLFGVRGDR